MEKAKELERIKEELTGREDFLMKQSKQSKNKQKLAVRLAARPWPPLPSARPQRPAIFAVASRACALAHTAPVVALTRSLPRFAFPVCRRTCTCVWWWGWGMHIMPGHG